MEHEHGEFFIEIIEIAAVRMEITWAPFLLKAACENCVPLVPFLDREEPGYVFFTLPYPHQQAFRNIAEMIQTQALSSPGWSLSSLSLSSCERFFSFLIVFVEVNKMLHLIRGIRIQRRKCFFEGGKNKAQANNCKKNKKITKMKH